MAVMDAQALTTDPDGMAFLADVLGTAEQAVVPGRRFPIEAWVQRPQAVLIEDRLEAPEARLAEVG